MNVNTIEQAAITVKNLTVAYENTPVLDNITISIPSGVLLGIVGPNGAGKTTFLKTLLGLIKPLCGSVSMYGLPLHLQRSLVAYVPQRTTVDWDFPVTVLDVVLMGTYHSLGWIRRPGKREREQAFAVLKEVDLVEYADRPIGKLSGGQQQRVFLARALIQNPSLYILDEPFNGVDSATEKKMIATLKKLCLQGKTIIVVHHDLQTLSDYFNWLLLLNVRCIAFGKMDDVLVPEYMCAAYGDRNLYGITLK